MEIEFEAMYKNIDKKEIRDKLKKLKAKLVKKEFLQKRIVYELPDRKINQWIRLRDEGDKITLTYKEIIGEKIDSQKEILVEVSDFEKTSEILKVIGLEKAGYQENYREVWILEGAEIMIDSWPFLEPLLEVEGKDEKSVKKVSEKLGFDYNEAIFGSVEVLYSEKFGINKEDLCKIAPVLKFDVDNPFVNS